MEILYNNEDGGFMGFLNRFKKEPENSNIQNADIEVSKKSVIPQFSKEISATPKFIPAEIFELLWFADGPYKNYFPKTDMNKFNIGNLVFEISFKGSSEPSAIYCKAPIKNHPNLGNITKMPYFPSYDQMTPEQRLLYLNWLTNIDSDIDIGYVFVFYYGLERHLFFGKYEEAFGTVLHLRQNHRNKSFLSYSSSALLAACLLHNRPDMFKAFIESESENMEIGLSGLYSMAKYGAGQNLSACELISMCKDVGFTNYKYIKEERKLFEQELKKLLVQRYGKMEFPIKDFKINQWPRKQELIAANYSLEPNQRSLEIPNLAMFKPFQEEVYELLRQSHENVKQLLKYSRTSGTKVALLPKDVYREKQQPSQVFYKSILFDGIDVKLFDSNVDYYNKGICPYCIQVMSHRPSSKGKCNLCGNMVFVKNNVFTDERVMLTETQVNEMNDIKSERSKRNFILNTLQSQGSTESIAAEIMKISNCKIEEALIQIVDQNMKRHKSNSNMGLYRNSMLSIGQIYEKFGNKILALEYYLMVCFIDLNGPNNGGYKRFEKEYAFLAPAVVDWLKNLSEEFGLTIEKLQELFLEKASSIYESDMFLLPKDAFTKLSKEIKFL